jgi:PhoH-like ATPase
MKLPDVSVFDTNVLIDSPELLLTPDKKFIIPYVVLKELDGLKKDRDLNFAVRKAIKIIYEQMQKGVVHITDLPDGYTTNDELIVSAAKEAGVPLITQDIGALAVAKARGVETVQDHKNSAIKGYSGFVRIKGDIEYENYVSYKELQFEEALHIFGLETIRKNEYLIVKRVGGKEDIWKEEEGKVVRISQSMKPYKDAGILITPLDSVQMCAWDAVTSKAPLTVLEGRVGSSKTLSALVGLLMNTVGQKRFKKFNKVYYTRAPIPVDKSLELGHMPGTMSEKAQQWIAGVTSNMRFLFGDEDWELLFNKHFEFISLESIQGLSLKPDEALLVDEYQLLSKDMLKQVLSRVGEGGKVILAGDPEQAYGVHRSNEGFKVVHEYVGTTDFINYVEMDSIYRSKFVEFVESMFK